MGWQRNWSWTFLGSHISCLTSWLTITSTITVYPIIAGIICCSTKWPKAIANLVAYILSTYQRVSEDLSNGIKHRDQLADVYINEAHLASAESDSKQACTRAQITRLDKKPFKKAAHDYLETEQTEDFDDSRSWCNLLGAWLPFQCNTYACSIHSSWSTGIKLKTQKKLRKCRTVAARIQSLQNVFKFMSLLSSILQRYSKQSQTHYIYNSLRNALPSSYVQIIFTA